MAGNKGTKHPHPAVSGWGIRKFFARILARLVRGQSQKKPRRLGIRELLTRARHRRDSGDLPGAAADYRAVVVERSDEIPVVSRASVYLGWVQLLEQVDLAEAIRTYLWLADRWRCEGRMHLAIGALRRVVALRPRDPEAHLRLARFLEDDGQVADAAQVYEAALQALRACNRTDEADALGEYIETLRISTGRKSA